VLAPLLPAGAACASSPIDDAEPALLADELAQLGRVAPRRRREVAFGRACARRALAELGLPATPIGRGEGGAPVWPPGILGSITHTRDVAAAAVIRAGDVRGLGIDLESLAEVSRGPELFAAITTASERARLAASPQLAAVVFSAKESVYKCLYPLGRRVLDHADVELAIDGDRFTVRRAEGYDARPVRGRFAIAAGLVASVAVLG
jgi:4'-phosphopantetheinyl transferase EntD